MQLEMKCAVLYKEAINIYLILYILTRKRLRLACVLLCMLAGI
jgi:hypothetical protein